MRCARQRWRAARGKRTSMAVMTPGVASEVTNSGSLSPRPFMSSKNAITVAAKAITRFQRAAEGTARPFSQSRWSLEGNVASTHGYHIGFRLVIASEICRLTSGKETMPGSRPYTMMSKLSDLKHKTLFADGIYCMLSCLAMYGLLTRVVGTPDTIWAKVLAALSGISVVVGIQDIVRAVGRDPNV
jgi:hypothetical protein